MTTNPHEDACSFGQYLASVRLEKGISLETVSRITKIGIDQLVFLEEEALTRMPAEVFVTGFIRAYADVVGADAEKALRLYRVHQSPARPARRSRLHLGRRRRRRMPRLVGMLLLFGALTAVSLYTYAALAKPGREAPPAPAAGTLPAGDTQGAPAEAPKGRPAESAGKKPAPMLLKVEAVEETRVKALIDGQTQVEYRLNPGEKAQLEASARFNLLIDNAGGTRLTLNGKPVLVPGKSGQAVNLDLPGE